MPRVKPAAKPAKRKSATTSGPKPKSGISRIYRSLVRGKHPCTDIIVTMVTTSVVTFSTSPSNESDVNVQTANHVDTTGNEIDDMRSI